LAKVADGCVAPQRYAARIRHDVTGDYLEESGLAGTIPADNRNSFTPANGETYPAEKFTVVIGLGDVGDTEHIFL
jgi:hypothetical protein